MSYIKITPEKLIALADEMDGKARAMKAKVEKVHSLAQGMKSVWQDNAQEEYDRDFTKLSESFEEYLAALPSFIDQAKEHANNMIRVGQ